MPRPRNLNHSGLILKTRRSGTYNAGRIDGGSEFRLYWEIALPVSRPMAGVYEQEYGSLMAGAVKG
jgi:ABC-type polysaccharide transport system permease subunit